MTDISPLQLKAWPAAGSVFDHWGGDCFVLNDFGDQCLISYGDGSPRSVIAYFEPAP